MARAASACFALNAIPFQDSTGDSLQTRSYSPEVCGQGLSRHSFIHGREAVGQAITVISLSRKIAKVANNVNIITSMPHRQVSGADRPKRKTSVVKSGNKS